MFRSSARTLRKGRLSFLPLLLAAAAAGEQHGMAQSLAASMFAAAPAPAPPANVALLTAPGSTLPDAPLAKPRMVRAATTPVDQPLLLPRNFQITPAASRTNVPGKVSYYLGSTWSIRNLLEAFAVAGVPSITTAPKEPAAPTSDDPVAAKQYQEAMDAYGDAIDSWLDTNEITLRYQGRRAEVGFATAETRQLISNLALPLAFHQEARYVPAPVNSDFSDRMWNALTSIVVTRNDAGMAVPNYSKLGGTVAAAFIGKSFYANAFKAPELDSGHFAMHYIEYSLLGDLATNTAHELIRAAVEPDMTMYNLHGRATDDSYYPLSLGGKVMYWAHTAYAPRNFITAVLITGLPATHHRPKEPIEGQPATWDGFPTYDEAYNNYGTGTLAWKDNVESNFRYHDRRLIGGISEAESQTMLQNLVIPVFFNQDPRYVPLGQGYSAGQRMSHAFEGILVGHNDAGEKRINLPILGGTVGAAYLAKDVYYPQLGTPALESNRVLGTTIGLNLAADAVNNLVGEFFRHRGY